MGIYILNTVTAGVDTLNGIIKDVPVAGLIGLTPAKSKDVSGFYNMRQYAQERNLPYYEVKSYTLNDNDDKKQLSRLEIDYLLVLGWQRLVPEWLIGQTKHAVIGSHGSPFGITQGRGRSPQNWTLIMGYKNFYISLFKIDAGIDSGKIIDTKGFELTEFDDIDSSYYKASLLTAQMYKNFFTRTNLDFKLQEQHEIPAYLPQRLPEDGALDWSRSSEQIRNFVRALTRPYPGAFTNIDSAKVVIWKVRLFVLKDWKERSKPGEILFMFNDGKFLVATGDGYLVVEEFEATVPLKTGMVFNSVSFAQQMENIFNRHREKYPDLPISSHLLDFAGKNI